MPAAEAPLLQFADFEPEAPLTVSEWADKYRVLDNSSAEPGQWNTARTPYLKEPMDAFCDPTVREIIMRTCTQIGKTSFQLNCLGFIVDHDPGPTMIVLPRDEDCRGWGAKKFRPMVEASPALQSHTTGKEDDLAGKLYQFDRMAVKFAGANSPADLSSDPCRYVLFDEIDKYPRFSGKEADPVKLGEERMKTYWNRKSLKVSTPTLESGYITRDFNRSDKRHFWLPCPRCGRYQPLSFRRNEGTGLVRFPEEATGEEIKRKALAWYECGKCAGRIEERERLGMLAAGVWCPQSCEVNDRGKIKGDIPSTDVRGYQLSVLYSPWVTWSETVAEFLETKDDAPLFMNFVNSWLGETWKMRAQEVKESHLKGRISTYRWGIVPKNAVVLTGGIDVQKDHFRFVVRAWGVGEESWLIRYGSVEQWEQLIQVVTIGYEMERQTDERMLRLFCIDSGFRTDEVYAYARQYQEILRPTKGASSLQATPIRRTHLDKFPNGKPIPGGINLWTLNTEYYKDKLNRLIHTQSGDPGEWHLPADRVESDYFAQMTSEHKQAKRDTKTGKVTESWEPVSEGRANHYWDCEAMALAAAEMLQVYALKADEMQPSTYVPSPRSGWVGGRKEEPAGRIMAVPTRGGWMKR